MPVLYKYLQKQLRNYLFLGKVGGRAEIYDAEKTVCDMVRYQKKVGMDRLKEVLKTYLKLVKTLKPIYDALSEEGNSKV